MGEVTLKYINGGTPSTAIPEYWDGTIPWTTSKSITSCTIHNGEKLISEEAINKSSSNIVPKNNVLIATRVGIGKSAVNSIDIAISQDLTGVILDKKIISPEFLVRYLHNQKLLKKLELSARGSTIKGLQRSDLDRIAIPLPPLPIQRRIVEILEQADALRRLRAQADAETQKLLQSVFYEMFGDPVRNEKGWDVKRIGDVIVESQYGCSHLGLNKGQYPIIGMNNITYDGRIDNTNLKFVNLPEKEFKKFQLNDGDILFNRTNAVNLVGKTGLFKDKQNFIFASYLIRLKVKKEVLNPEFFWAFLNSPFTKRKFSAMSKKAVNQANINALELQSLSILLPPLSLQQKFARIIVEIENVRDKQIHSKQEVERLYQGLMAKAFNGELVA